MKIRDLVEVMERVKDAQDDVLHSGRAIEHGGCAETMEHKYNALANAEEYLEQILEEDVS